MKDKNEGEGNKTADRNYREGVRKHLKSHDVSSEGRKAAQALDDAKQGKELRKAEADARKPRK
jgi:hypothetical protein